MTSVFDNIEDAILLVDVEANETYRLLMANEAFARYTGHDRQAAIGKTVDEIVSPESYRLISKQYKKVVESKKPLEWTAWFTVPLGRQMFEVKLIPILNTVGECAQIAAITRNVTELYRLRHEVKRLRTGQPAA